jgi:prepilin-type processing-associated H-X9-DG protein
MLIECGRENLIMKTHRNLTTGAFTWIELVAVLAALVLVVGIVLPALVKAKARSSRVSCVNNLKQVGLSFRVCALDNEDRFPMQVSVTNGGTMELIGQGAYVHFLVMSNELNTPKVLVCPEEPKGARTMATTFSPSVPPGVPHQIPFTGDQNVSYFVGVDADETQPQMFLSGDRNLALNKRQVPTGMLLLSTNSPVTWANPRPRHNNGGNIGLADGSVHSVNNARLQKFLHDTGTNTIRLSIP